MLRICTHSLNDTFLSYIMKYMLTIREIQLGEGDFSGNIVFIVIIMNGSLKILIQLGVRTAHLLLSELFLFHAFQLY